MANDPNNPNEPGTEEAPRSLREVAEAAWEEAESTTPGEPGSEQQPQAGQSERQRDNLGRFVSAPAETPGEQSTDPAQVRDQTAPPVQPPSPAPIAGSSSEAPAHWSAEDKATFAKLPKEGQEFLLKRHQAMEADYQSKVQANATAVQFTQALAPVFENQAMKASLANVEGRPLHPVHAIQQWAAFHLRAMSPNVQDRIGLVQELMQRLQLDPAAVFGQGNQPVNGLSEEDMKDPAIKFFADHVSKTAQEVQALRGQLQDFHRQQSEASSAESLRVTRWQIDQYADEKDAQGNLLRPYFDTVLPQVIELFNANPNRDLNEAYNTAVWMNPQLRDTLLAKERQSVEQRQSNARAAAAARGNTRGRTSPVTKPTEGEGPKGLRATLAAAADEAGL